MYHLSPERRYRVGPVRMTLWQRFRWRRSKPCQGAAGLIPGSQPWRATHRHHKGGEYRVLAHGVLEADRSEAVIYDDQEGQIWVRSKSEFYDGRFMKILASIER